MLDHLSLGTTGLDRAVKFYDAALGTTRYRARLEQT